MTLQDIITRIEQAESSLSRELENDNLDLAQEYLNYSQELLGKIVEMKSSLSPEDLQTAKEFAQAYAEHIKEQVKILAVEQAKVGEQFKQVKNRHRISNKYTQMRRNTSK